MMHTTRAKRVTPIADAASRPMPKPAPTIDRPAPKPAARNASAMLPMCFLFVGPAPVGSGPGLTRLSGGSFGPSGTTSGDPLDRQVLKKPVRAPAHDHDSPPLRVPDAGARRGVSSPPPFR